MAVKLIEKRFELKEENLQDFDIFKRFAVLFFNDLGFVPKVHKYGRKGTTGYIVQEEVKGQFLYNYLWKNNFSLSNTYFSYHTVVNYWPYLIYTTFKKYMEVDDYVLELQSNLSANTIVTKQGELKFFDLTAFKLKYSHNALYRMFYKQDNESMFFNALGHNSYLRHSGAEPDQPWILTKEKLIKKIAGLEAEKQFLEHRNKKLITYDTLKQVLGEDKFALYFGEEDE